MNGMNYVRGSRHDFDQWRNEGCVGWGYDDVLPYFKKSEDIQIPELMNSCKLKTIKTNDTRCKSMNQLLANTIKQKLKEQTLTSMQHKLKNVFICNVYKSITEND